MRQARQAHAEAVANSNPKTVVEAGDGACARGHIGALADFLGDSRGEMAPASYIVGVFTALALLFFTFDLGLRKGARLAVEYAAYCGARAAATQLPTDDKSGACVSAAERDAVRTATAACLTAVVSKRGVFGLELPGSPAIPMLIERAAAEDKTRIRMFSEGSEIRTGDCIGHNALITVEVEYDHYLPVPLSPLNWGNDGHVKMVAQAYAMLQTVK